jgi:hypothetical protein
LRRVRDTCRELWERACVLENDSLLAIHGRALFDVAILAELPALRRRWEDVLLELYILREGAGETVTMAIFGEQPTSVLRLTAAYHRAVGTGAQRVAVWQFLPGPPAPRDRRLPPAARLVTTPDRLFRGAAKITIRRWDPLQSAFLAAEQVAAMDGVIGCALEIRGPAALLRFVSEDGLHTFHEARGNSICLVDTSAGSVTMYTPPEGIDRRGAIGNQDHRRIYRLEQDEIEDLILDRKFRVRADELHLTLADVIEQVLRRRVRRMLD